MKPDKTAEKRHQKDLTNEPHSAEDLSVNANEQVTKADVNNESDANGRSLHEVPKLPHSEGESTIARDNDSDNLNGLLRFNDNKDEERPAVTEKFVNESVKKGDN